MPPRHSLAMLARARQPLSASYRDQYEDVDPSFEPAPSPWLPPDTHDPRDRGPIVDRSGLPPSAPPPMGAPPLSDLIRPGADRPMDNDRGGDPFEPPPTPGPPTPPPGPPPPAPPPAPPGTPPGTPPPPPAPPSNPTARQAAIDAFRRQVGNAPFDDAVRRAYQQFLGRTPNPDEIASHRGNLRGLMGIYETIYDSPEGVARRTGPAATPGPDGTTEPPPDVGTYRGLFAGFNFDQDAANRDRSKSAKYGFAELAGPAAMRDQRWQGLGENGRPDMEGFFNEHVRPRLEAEGYTIHQVIGDKIEITTREGRHWVDWVQDAGSTDPNKPPRLAWQAQTANGGWLHAGAGGGLELPDLPPGESGSPGSAGSAGPATDHSGPPRMQDPEGVHNEAYVELADVHGLGSLSDYEPPEPLSTLIQPRRRGRVI